MTWLVAAVSVPEKIAFLEMTLLGLLYGFIAVESQNVFSMDPPSPAFLTRGERRLEGSV